MKKMIAALLAVATCFSFAACGNNNPFDENNGEDTAAKVVLKVGILGTSTEQEIFRKYKKYYSNKNSKKKLQ